MFKKKIVYVTGSRAEYGVMLTTLRLIQQNPYLELVLIVTGMHLSKKYGNTVKGIKMDNFTIGASVNLHLETANNVEMAISLGHCLIGIAKAFNKIKPDIVLIQGDRGEMLAAAIAAAHMNIPVIHVSGGDISGSIDNSIRKAISNFSHYHLADNEENSKRLIKTGEESWRVKTIGSPGLNINKKELYSLNQINSRLEFKIKKPLVIVLQHPVTTESLNSKKQMKIILEAIIKIGNQSIVIYPNSDAGSFQMIQIIKEYTKKFSFIHSFRSMSRKLFLSLLSVADLMIGNSSSGLFEAPLFCLPVINLGSRQFGRIKGNNVYDLDFDIDKIFKKSIELISKKR